MMKIEMSTELVSHNKERILQYKAFSVGYSFPGKNISDFFPEFSGKEESLAKEYDTIFRQSNVWPYTTEYLSDNEFQRANYLADIMGFYKAFGVSPDKERPDSIAAELEFMYYLLLKIEHVVENNPDGAKDKTDICFDAQKKFFNKHFYPGVKLVAQKILESKKDESFYSKLSESLLDFLEIENDLFKD